MVLKRTETLTDEVPYRWKRACGLGVGSGEGYLEEPVGGVLGAVITGKLVKDQGHWL